MKLQPDDGPGSSLSIEPRFRRCSEISSEFARRFVERIRKLVGSMPEEDQMTYRKNVGGYRIGGRFGLQPKKIGSGCQCALRRRTRE
ncbi:hypothetical protein GW17_00048414 [Ensete ventricosum]|nr:hypothetical protein GW17_00048414 [Ensete ventricosum]